MKWRLFRETAVWPGNVSCRDALLQCGEDRRQLTVERHR